MNNLTTLTIIWLALPFLLGFVSYLFTQGYRFSALITSLVSTAYVIPLFLLNSPLEISLLDSFGVFLVIDQLSAFFILTNALVTLAVIVYCWQTGKSAFFYLQLMILHGSVNATFICADFISLYVALEVISISAFLLISYPRTDTSIWVGLRYLFVSNTAMLFYLVGAGLIYQTHNSFSYQGLQGSPSEAIALIFLGLLVKGGIFVSGLWLPLTHSQSLSPVSAILSGVVVKAGVFPLVRLALMIEEIDPIVRIFGVATAVLGVLWSILAQDTKVSLAFSTISQLGFILAAPMVAGFYALTHGLVKSALFLISGILPSRDFKQLQRQSIETKIWIPLVIASFSISGFPLLSGFGAKILTAKNLLPWQVIAMNIVTVGTAIVYAKFVFLPHGKKTESYPIGKTDDNHKKVPSSFWLSMVILLGGLVGANIFYYQAYTWGNVAKPLVTIALGWLAYWLFLRKVFSQPPKGMVEFNHLIGVMSLMLVFVFWMVRV